MVMSEENRLRSWLQYIIDIGYDYDGYESRSDLKDLIDELVGFAKSALDGEKEPYLTPDEFVVEFEKNKRRTPKEQVLCKMNIYEARWNNAKKKALKIKKLLDTGYMILDEETEIIGVKLTEDEFLIQYGENTWGMMFEKTLDMDHGMYTPIKEFNRMFDSWKVAKIRKVKI